MENGTRFTEEQLAEQAFFTQQLREEAEGAFEEDTIPLNGIDFLNLAVAFGVEVSDKTRTLIKGVPCVLYRAQAFTNIGVDELGEITRGQIAMFEGSSENISR